MNPVSKIEIQAYINQYADSIPVRYKGAGSRFINATIGTLRKEVPEEAKRIEEYLCTRGAYPHRLVGGRGEG